MVEQQLQSMTEAVELTSKPAGGRCCSSNRFSARDAMDISSRSSDDDLSPWVILKAFVLRFFSF